MYSDLRTTGRVRHRVQRLTGNLVMQIEVVQLEKEVTSEPPGASPIMRVVWRDATVEDLSTSALPTPAAPAAPT